MEKQQDSETVRGKDKTEVALKMEDDSKPAWLPFKTKPSIGTDVAQKLLVIGEQLLGIDQPKNNHIFHFREKADTLGRVCCIHRLLLHCDRLLLWLVALLVITSFTIYDNPYVNTKSTCLL